MDLKRIFKFKLKQIVGIRAYALSLCIWLCAGGFHGKTHQLTLRIHFVHRKM